MKTYKEFINEAQVRFSKNLYKDKVPDDVLDNLVNSDPTSTKTYCDWIVKGYLKSDNKSVYLEDLYKVTEYLLTYEKMKKRNLINKDIFSFKNYKDLFLKIKEVGGFGEPTESDTYLIEDRYYINNKEAEIYFEDEHYLIVIPRTYEASKFYANKTQWCTRFPDNYESYSKEGELYIIIDKDKLYTMDVNKLLQFHFQVSPQFMDMNDTTVDLKTKKKFLSIFDNIKEKYLLRYDYVSKFINDRATVGIKTYKKIYVDDKINDSTWKFGLIDSDGNELTEIKYDKIDYFSGINGMYLVSVGEGKKGIINKDGKEILPMKYEYINYDMGVLIVKIKFSSKTTGVFDKNGKVVIPLKYSNVQRGHYYNRETGGYTYYYTVSLDSDDGDDLPLYGILDDKGNEILPVRYYNCLVSDTPSDFYKIDDNIYDKVYKDGVLYLGYTEIKTTKLKW
jgi:hypothetical protein